VTAAFTKASNYDIIDWRSEHEAVGLARDALYLLRPDTYVALADASGEPDAGASGSSRGPRDVA
jgi:hypothetical protein